MRKLILILFCMCSTMMVRAVVFYSINTDFATIEGINGAYKAQYEIEKHNKEVLDKILNHYTKAEVATAGIFLSKSLDRKAIKNAGGFGNAEENFYYRRIYNMVSAEIMPRILRVSILLIKYPEQAMIWGPYLYRVTNDVQELCKQFECVVCNGRLTFQDVVFFTLTDSFKELFDLARLGNVDWKAMFNDFANFAQNLTRQDFVADFHKLSTLGASLASAGGLVGKDVMNDLNGSVKYAMTGKLNGIANALGTFREAYSFATDPLSVRNAVMEKLITTDSIGVLNLLKADSYDVSNYITDYLSNITGQYYKQRYYIKYEDSGREEVCNYIPCEDPDCINHSMEWMRFNSDHEKTGLTSKEYDMILKNSESFAGWNREKVNQLNATDDRYTYFYDSWLRSSHIYRGGLETVVSNAYAFEVHVTRVWNETEVVYEEVFDSYNMDLDAFLLRMNAKVNEYNMNQDVDNGDGTFSEPSAPRKYVLTCDDKVFYTEADEQRMRGCESVSFILNCSGGGSMGEASFSWKEHGSHNHKDIREDSKQYAMETTLSEMSDLSDLDAQIAEYEQQIKDIDAQIRELKRNQLVPIAGNIRPGSNSSSSGVNDDKIKQLEDQKAVIQAQLEQARQARQQALDDYADEMDGYKRIPSVMRELEKDYQIVWNDEGSWSGSGEEAVFTRTGRAQAVVDAQVTFTATLKCERGESHFLGIRTHRAILAVSWKLASVYESSDIVDIITLDPKMDDVQKTEIVNKRLHELQLEYPNCSIELEYAYSAPAELEDEDDNKRHLLWVSSRLIIAREVEYRLSDINSQLIIAEKMLLQRESLLHYFKRTLFGDIRPRRRGMGAGAYRRWRNAATHVSHGNDPKSIEIDNSNEI